MPSHQFSMSFGDPSRPSRVFDLEQPRTDTMPIHPGHLPGYKYILHGRHEDTYGQDGPRSGAAGMLVMMEHTGTHIDAFCHQAADMTLCGGIPVDQRVQSNHGFSRHGVEQIAPIVAPGVLLDITAHHGVDMLPPGYAVTVADLEDCCTRQGVEIGAGMVALVYTGNERLWDEPQRYLAGPGVAGSANRD